MNLIAFALLIIASVCIGGMAECRKAFQVRNGTGLKTTLAFSAINSAIAAVICCFFINGYHFDIGRTGLSLLYAVVTIVISSLCLVGSAWGNVTILVACANLGGLVFPSLYGVITNPADNKMSVLRIIGFVFALACIAIIFWDGKSDKQSFKFKISCVLVFFVQGSALIIFSIIDKYFGTVQYFNFMAEYMLITTVLLIPLIFILGKKNKTPQKSKVFTKFNFLYAAIYAVLFFASEYLSLKCVSLVPLTFQAPVSFCIPIIVIALFEKLIYGIKISKSELWQIAFAMVSCICFIF